MTRMDYLDLEQAQPPAILRVCEAVSSLADTRVLAEMDEVVQRLRDEQTADVVVDLGQADYFGSTLLEALRMLWNDLHARGGRLVLCNLSSVGREVLEISHFDRIWHLAGSRADALRWLEDSGKPRV